ncbi:cytochrome P450 [Xylaria digitata]|nr:cytochrome P450 [Xylaria digitata]
MSRLTALRGVALFATVTYLWTLRYYPDVLGHRRPISLLVVIGSGCLSVFFVYVLLIYPVFLSPLRYLAGPKTAVTFMANSLLKSDLVLVDAIQNRLVVTDPSLFADLFVHNTYDFIKRPGIAEVLNEFIGLGLVTLEGDAHKFLRKNTLPAFTSLTSQLAEKGPEKDTTSIDMNIWASKVTLDIIGIEGLGRELNTIEDFNNPLAKAYDELTEVTLERGIYMLLSMLFGLKAIRLLPWRMNGVFKSLRRSLVSICESMVVDKREAVRKDADHHSDVLSLLIKTGNFTNTELDDQLLTFLAAGTLERMPLLNGVINETLRLYPTVPLTIRQAYTEFRPARWISEDGKPNQTGGASSNYHFITFLHGPRSCIRQGFARAELRCLLAALLLSFEWELAMLEADVVPRGAITIKPANGMDIRLKRLASDDK